MASTLSKEHSLMAYPRTFLTIIAYVVGLAMFLCLASSLLISQPIGSTVRSYFYGIDSSQKSYLVSSVNGSVVDSPVDKVEIEGQRDSTELDKSKTNDGKGGDWRSNGEADGIRGEVGKKVPDSDLPEVDKSSESRQGNKSDKTTSVDTLQNSTPQTIDQDSTKKSNGKSSDDLREGDGEKHQVTKSPENSGSSESGQGKDFVNSTSTASSENSTTATYVENVGGVGNTSSSSEPTKKRETDSIDSECDLYHGKWVFDLAGPLYTNNSCPVLTQMQNCQGNGRPDKDYENWRWKPNQCDLPRFNPRKFLELMRGKTLAFIGDSVARNQMESMLCILWQAEEPKNRGNKRMQRYFFKSTSTTIVRIWSSWLVHQTTDPFDYAPAGVTKLHLDAPDEGFMEYIKEFDVVVLSSGHWFAKQSVYILNNEIVGGQLWWPDKSKKMKVNNIEAFGISVETILSSMATDANYSGITIVRSYSPDHYEGGAWNTGGSCTGKVKPATDSELVENGFTNIMHEKQVTGFNRAIKKQTNKSTLKLMDITQVFSYRHDGHPGPYRSPDPNKVTKRGPDGKPPPQDCLHWCMPGPVDTWNELVSEIIRQEYEHKTVSS